MSRIIDNVIYKRRISKIIGCLVRIIEYGVKQGGG